MIDKEKVKQFLGSGLSPAVVASAVGCEQQYINQLLEDEAFFNEVSLLKLKNLTAHTQRDQNIDEIEDGLLERLKNAVNENLFYKPHDILKAFAVVNASKRRGVQASPDASASQQVIALTIPVQVINQFKTTPTGEVIEVEGKTLVTMPSHALLGKLSEAAKANGSATDYQRIARHLPAAIEHGIVTDDS